MQFNIPTLLTLFRVILIPFFVLVFYLPVTWSPFAAALIFCVAAVTDWFDGFLARRWNQSTRGFEIVWPQFLTLMAIGGAFFTIALLRFRKTIGTMA